MNEPSSKFKQYLFIATYVILLSYLLINLKEVSLWSVKLLRILSPFTIGLGIAFVLNIPMKILETKCLKFIDQSKSSFIKNTKRPLAILLTLILVFGFLVGLTLFIIPQLTESMAALINNIPGYARSLEKLMNDYLSSSDLVNQIGNELLATWQDFLQIGSKFLGTSLAGLLTMTLGFTASVVNIGLALVLAVYMLASKEKLIIQIKKVLFAFFNKNTAVQLIHIGHISEVAFHRFVAGQFTEALIIGLLCFIGMNLLAMPYPLLISVIIAVTSLIPIFGAFIGTIPSAFIIFIIDPLKALWFIVFIIVLQQFEGNIIYPRVVGNSIGLSGLWVMLAMVIGGSTFGILGMLIGIPLFSILYQLLRTLVYNKLKAKKIIKVK